MKETQTIYSASYSLEQVNTIKLQRDLLTPLFCHAFYLFFYLVNSY